MSAGAIRLLRLLTVAIGGGSLVLFAYFLFFGTPFAIPLASSDAACYGVDAALCLAFFLQHSGMIRRGAKERFAKRLPMICYPAFYSIASGLALIALVVLWQPTDRFLFHLGGPARWLPVFVALLSAAGFAWGIRALREFDPFGARVLSARLRGTTSRPIAFVARGPYRHVRHPLYLFMLLLIWSTPRLSTDQLLFNVLWTAWIVVGTRLEERDLVAEFGRTYLEYQSAVPMLIPSLRPSP